MWKNLLTFMVSLSLCAGLFWWLAPKILEQEPDQLPGYGQLVQYDPARPGGHLKPSVDALVKGDRIGAGVRWITNSQGFRNRQEVSPFPRAGTLRILFYGDSFVDGLRTGQDRTIGARLEGGLSERLGRAVEVVISGHNNPANAWFHWQSHGRHIHPQIVVLGLTVGNDLTSHNFGAGILPVLRNMDELVAVDRAVGATGVWSAAMIPSDGFLPRHKWSRWQLWWTDVNQSLAHRFYFLSDRARPAMSPPYPGAPGKALAADDYVSLGLYYQRQIPFIQAAWRDFEILLAGFVAQIRHFGSLPAMVEFPTRPEALPRDWNRLAGALQLDSNQFDMGQPSRRLALNCRELELPCLETGPALRQAQKEAEVFRPLGDMHLNDHGQAAVAEAMVDFLEPLTGSSAPTPPGPNWLEAYRKEVGQWAELVLATEVQWLDMQTGAGRLDLPDDRESLEVLMTQGWRSDGKAGPFWGGEGKATIRLPVRNPAQGLCVTLRAKPFLATQNGNRQRVRVRSGGVMLVEWQFDEDAFVERSVLVPANRLVTPWTAIGLEFPDALVPAEMGLSSDRRRLGVAVAGLDLRPATC